MLNISSMSTKWQFGPPWHSVRLRAYTLKPNMNPPPKRPFTAMFLMILPAAT